MEAFAVPDLPEIGPGDDLAPLVAERVDVRPNDVVLVASTVVSKAAGRTASLADFPPGPRARELAAELDRARADDEPAPDPRFVQAILDESTELLMEAPFLLTATRFGHVAVNAGIDRSNTGGSDLLLLPRRPSEHAAAIRDELGSATGREEPAVVVTDTCGRPFRHGQTGVAIGWDGIAATRDWRGTADRDGRELEATVQAVVDELAGAANLVAGEGDGGTPVVVVRGWSHDGASGPGLFRDVRTDFVRQALRGWSFDPAAHAERPEPRSNDDHTAATEGNPADGDPA
jgi:coenzyme F420-0:L-glutamate ligase/coenzyme F420-1:gamma-L-glutamate ligase